MRLRHRFDGLHLEGTVFGGQLNPARIDFPTGPSSGTVGVERRIARFHLEGGADGGGPEQPSRHW